MSVEPGRSREAAILWEADRAQARYFHSELGRQIAALQQQISNHRRALERLRTRSDAGQIRRTEQALRSSEKDLAALARMMESLTTRFTELRS